MNSITVPDNTIQEAVTIIRSGGIVAFPTETYYGLGVDPFNENALAKLFEAKGRPLLKPVLLLVADQRQVMDVAENVPEIAQKLMVHYWPGPLTMVLPAKPNLSSYVTGNTGTVGVRLSPHPVAKELLRLCKFPLTATSANKAGAAPAVTASDIYAAFDDQIDIVLDGGSTPGETGSTLIGFEGGKVYCIREGSIPFDTIESFLKKT